MKSVILVLVCVVLVGCPLKPSGETVEPRPPINPTEPCLVGKTACIVKVGDISLIRAPTFWLLDLRGRSEFDVGKVINAARACDGPKGCGVAMTKPEIKVLVRDLAQAKGEKLSLAGGLVAVYRLAEKRIVAQLLGDFEKIVTQLPALPIGDNLCDTGQCELPPPIPPRYRDLGGIVTPINPVAR